VIGERLGKYEITSRIGAGGMAEVWKGRRVEGISKAVAIKILWKKFDDDPHVQKLFRDEANNAAALTHSGIVSVFDVAERGEKAYFVMEWVDGFNLSLIREMLAYEGRRMPVHMAAHIVGEVAKALDYAHNVQLDDGTRGVIHRDVSPQNVLLSVSGEVMLTDFGIARTVREHSSIEDLPKGKIHYAAPEQFRTGVVAPQVDLYSLGAVFHELLSGRKFRPGETSLEVACKVLEGEIPPLGRDDVPEELDHLMRSLLDMDPARRPQTARAVRDMLKAWPGFRDASDELGELCSGLSMTDGPRSGLHEAVGSKPMALDRIPDADAPTPGGTASPDTQREASYATGKDLVPAERERPRSPRFAYLAAFVVTLIGLGGFLGGMAWRSPKDERPAQAKTPALAKAPAVAPEPEPMPEPAPAAKPEPKPEPAPVAAPEPEPKPKPEARPRKKPSPAKPAPAKAKVRFLLDGPNFAYVRIDRRKQVLLEPIGKASLKPGRHRFEWRLSEKNAWQDGGRYDLEPGKAYDVDVAEDALKIQIRE